MRKRLSFARRATTDLDEIWEYSERNWGREQALRYLSEITARCEALAEGEIIPREVEFESGRFFRIRSGSHFVFLRDMSHELRVVRVLHERENAEAAFS